MIKLFENFNELDPYGGEDDWGGSNMKFQVGDIVKCKMDDFIKHYFEKNRKYRVSLVSIIGGEEVIKLDNQSGWWRAFRFEKVNNLQESVDIDPYGEEDDWGTVPIQFKVGDIVMCDVIDQEALNYNFDRNKKYKVIGVDFWGDRQIIKIWRRGWWTSDKFKKV